MKLISYSDLEPAKGIKFCRVHLMRLVGKGDFPTPVAISDRRVAWIEKEVDDWLASRANRRNAKAA